MSNVVIVGAGQAGYQCADSLRQGGFGGSITLIGEEPYPPYQRPPLSKAYLLGESDADRVQFRAPDYYSRMKIDLRVDTRVVSVDRAAHLVELQSGDMLPYDCLVLATGARVRTLAIPGADLDGVCYLKTLQDVNHIDDLLKDAETVTVIGAGFIGLEFAAVARKLGKAVTVLEAMDRVLARVAPPVLSDYYAELQGSRGAKIVCGASVTEFVRDNGHIRAVRCADGREIPCGVAVVGIGVIPNTELAEQIGLDCDNGICVDALGRSSDPNVYAAGDVASYRHPFADRRMRLESVQNAIDQAKAVAATIAGAEKPYTTIPWFWSDQFEFKLQMVGLSEGCDSHVQRGDMADGRFSIFHYRDGRLRAIDSVNKPADHMMGRRLLAAGLSPTPEQAADGSFPLKSLL